MSLFKKYFLKVLSEDNIASAGGVFGNNATVDTRFPGGGDTYAPGDARIPHVLGTKKKKKKKTKCEKCTNDKVQRRKLPGM